MADEIQKFDPSTLMQGVKDRIKATFVSLVPDDQWDAMVQKEILSFFEEQQIITLKEERRKQDANNYWSQEIKYDLKTLKATPFRALVYDLCVQKTAEKIKAMLEEQWFGTLGNNFPIKDGDINKKLQEIIDEAAPMAMLRFFTKLMEQQMMQLRNDVRNTGINI